MNKIPPDTMVDKVVMLLSTDWFLPYWSVIRIDAAEQGPCVQGGCRKIVLELMSAATDYYRISFSEERLEDTRQKVRVLAKQCGLAESAETRINELIEPKPGREQFYKGAWLFRTLAVNLVKDGQLDATTELVVERTINEQAGPNHHDFENLCSESSSGWDKYTRSLTPGLPTSLADLLSEDLIAGELLTSVLSRLTPAQGEGLLSRFQSIAKSVAGVDVDHTWRPV